MTFSSSFHAINNDYNTQLYLLPAAFKKKASGNFQRPFDKDNPSGLVKVLVYQLGHLEHVDLALAAEDWFELGVSIDVPSVLLVLQFIPLDVRPDLLYDLSARQRFRSDDGRQLRVRLHGLHELFARFLLCS
jgi:hypothetical protein